MGIDNVKFAKPGNARWRVVQRATDAFVVYRPDGMIDGIYPSLNRAAAIAGIRQKEDDTAARRTTRPCLCCTKPFESEGIHNRLCDFCRRQNGELIPYAIAPRNGRAR